MHPSIGFDGIYAHVANNPDQAKEDLQTYFEKFNGRWFEYFSALSDPGRIDANDIAACATLSVELPGRSVNELMTNAEPIAALLANCPPNTMTLWDIDTASPEYTALSNLYDMIRTIDGMGQVRTSKLLASKFPHLVPIRDSVVEQLLTAGHQWWEPWRQTVSNPNLRNLVAEITPANVPKNTSVLRKLDIILWMHGHRTA